MSEPQSQDGNVRQFVSFTTHEEEFGVDILSVQEIIRPVEITRVPHAPDFVEGVVNLRGQILPVIDLRERFGFPGRETDAETRIIITEVAGQEVGFIADSVQEVTRVKADKIEPAPELAVGIEGRYIDGVARLDERLLILLDLQGVLSTEETQSVQQVAQEEKQEAQKQEALGSAG